MKRKISTVTLNVILIVFSLITLLPFIWMLLSSFKTNVELSANAQSFIPQQFSLRNYADVLQKLDFLRYFSNSLLYAVLVTLIGIYTSTTAGFVLSKYKFKGRQALFTGILLTMMVPGIVTFIPRYSIMQTLGWLDTYQALLVPVAFSVFGIFMMRQACFSIPDEMLEAARIDGANGIVQ